MPEMTLTQEQFDELKKMETEYKKVLSEKEVRENDAIKKAELDKMVNDIIAKLHPAEKPATFVPCKDKDVSMFEINGKKICFGDFLLLAKNQDAVIKTALSTTSAQGGYTIPAEWYTEIINIISNTSKLLPMFRTVPMKTTPLHLNSILTDVTVYISEEATAKSVTKPTFSQADLALRYIYAIISATNELNSDTVISLDTYLKELVGKAIARTMELEMLEGTTICTGLKTATGVNAVPQAGANLSFDDLIDACNHTGQMEDYRANSIWVLNRTAMKLLLKLKDNQNQPLWSLNLPVAGQPPSVLGYPYVMSDQISTAVSNTIYFGDPLALWVGYKVGEEGLNVLFSNVANDGTYNFFTQNMVGWRFELRRAELPAIPAAFVRLTGVK